MAYIDAVKQLESLVKIANGANKTLLGKAAELIKRSESLQEEAYILIAESYQSANYNDLELEDNIHSQFVYINNFDEFEEKKKEQGVNREVDEQAVSGIAYVITAVEKNNIDEVVSWLKNGRKLLREEK
ncbi:hypothetical protein ABNR98_004471 [Salmonella enterica]